MALLMGFGSLTGRALADPQPDLRVTATLDRQQYHEGDQAQITFTITNDGAVAANGVQGTGEGALNLGNWVNFTRIEPGATEVLQFTSSIAASPGTFAYSGDVSPLNGQDATPDNNHFSVTGSLLPDTSTFGGVLYGDRNVNGTMDVGETGLAGVPVNISGPVSEDRTTDAQGRFSFADIPTGSYFVTFGFAPGWIVDSLEPIDLDTSDRNADIRVRAVPPLNLDVSMRFDRDTYQAGDTVNLTVVLTNRGTNTLAGITAVCPTGQGGPALRGGAGWGPLAEGGVTVAAGRTVTVPVSEPLPANAPQFGFVEATCDFNPAGFPPLGQVFVRARANVTGVATSATGLIYEDRNSNGALDDGEQLPGVTVVITDVNTGAEVARPVTDPDGRFSVDGVVSGTYDLRVDGPWKPRFAIGWFRFAVVAENPQEPTFGVQAAAPGENTNRPNIRVSATFDKPAYNSGEAVHARITVTNIGSVAAEGVRVSLPNSSGTGLRVDLNAWGDLSFFGPGAHFNAGETRVYDIPGDIENPDVGTLFFGATLITSNGEINSANNTFLLSVPVTKTFGDYAGVVYGDRNDNGRLDSGEELPGVRASLAGMVTGNRFEALTDAHGHFAFTQVPTGLYIVFFSEQDGWVMPGVAPFRIDETDDPDAQLRATRPLSERLRATVDIRELVTHIGDTVHVRVTLTNTGLTPIEHIRAWCNGIGDSNELDGVSAGWGALRFNADGVTVRPGQTKTVDVTDVVPQGADLFGWVGAACEFGPEQILGLPGGFDTANIEGKSGPFHGRLMHGDTPVPHIRVALVLPGTHCPAAFATTDADGSIEVANLPARVYQIVLLGPWKPADGEDLLAFVYSGFDPGQRFYQVIPR